MGCGTSSSKGSSGQEGQVVLVPASTTHQAGTPAPPSPPTTSAGLRVPQNEETPIKEPKSGTSSAVGTPGSPAKYLAGNNRKFVKNYLAEHHSHQEGFPFTQAEYEELQQAYFEFLASNNAHESCRTVLTLAKTHKIQKELWKPSSGKGESPSTPKTPRFHLKRLEKLKLIDLLEAHPSHQASRNLTAEEYEKDIEAPFRAQFTDASRWSVLTIQKAHLYQKDCWQPKKLNALISLVSSSNTGNAKATQVLTSMQAAHSQPTVEKKAEAVLNAIKLADPALKTELAPMAASLGSDVALADLSSRVNESLKMIEFLMQQKAKDDEEKAEMKEQIKRMATTLNKVDNKTNVMPYTFALLPDLGTEPLGDDAPVWKKMGNFICRKIAEPMKRLAWNKMRLVFLCPITQTVMIDPVMCSDGHSYERQFIEEWLQVSSRSPLTNMVYTHTHTYAHTHA